MTPRLHGIYHSIVDEERDSNFFTNANVTSGKMLRLPFRGTNLLETSERR